MTRKISRAGRERMAEAGRRSIEALHARTQADARAEVEAFRNDLLRALGDTSTAMQRGLVESAAMTLAAILRTRKDLLKRRCRNSLALTERAGWLAGNFARTLERLKLPVPPRPTCLADLLQRKDAAEVQNSPQNLTISAPTPTETAPKERK